MRRISRRRSTSSAEVTIEEARTIVQEAPIRHVGLIVDGNRRWAARRGLQPVEGHRKALSVLLERIKDAAEFGVSVLSFWLFSTENWRRSTEQIDSMFDLGREVKDQLRNELMSVNARFRHIGRKSAEADDEGKELPDDIRLTLAELERDTASNTGLLAIAAINYGGRDEIVRAANAALSAGEKHFTRENLARYLDTVSIPDPDLVIRTSGEVRTSGFMIWQTEYSEWFFPKTLFPDFDRAEFVNTLRMFNERRRRYGGG